MPPDEYVPCDDTCMTDVGPFSGYTACPCTGESLTFVFRPNLLMVSKSDKKIEISSQRRFTFFVGNILLPARLCIGSHEHSDHKHQIDGISEASRGGLSKTIPPSLHNLRHKRRRSDFRLLYCYCPGGCCCCASICGPPWRWV